MTVGRITEKQIDAAAKEYCCPNCECIPTASYCAIHNERDMIRRMLNAALVNGEGRKDD